MDLADLEDGVFPLLDVLHELNRGSITVLNVVAERPCWVPDSGPACAGIAAIKILAFKFILKIDKLFHRTKIISNMNSTCRLYSRN